MAAGLPVVACRAAAVPEIVEDRRTGLLVDPRRPDQLAAALETTLTDTKLSEEFGRTAARRGGGVGPQPVARPLLQGVPLPASPPPPRAFPSPPVTPTRRGACAG